MSEQNAEQAGQLQDPAEPKRVDEAVSTEPQPVQVTQADRESNRDSENDQDASDSDQA